MNKSVYCTSEQLETDHTVTVDSNGEFVFTCPCGRFIKLPGHLKTKEINEALNEHKAENEGKVLLETLEKENTEKLSRIDEA